MTLRAETFMKSNRSLGLIAIERQREKNLWRHPRLHGIFLMPNFLYQKTQPTRTKTTVSLGITFERGARDHMSARRKSHRPPSQHPSMRASLTIRPTHGELSLSSFRLT